MYLFELAMNTSSSRMRTEWAETEKKIYNTPNPHFRNTQIAIVQNSVCVCVYSDESRAFALISYHPRLVPLREIFTNLNTLSCHSSLAEDCDRPWPAKLMHSNLLHVVCIKDNPEPPFDVTKLACCFL
jgi:hypothetical protein